MAPNHDARPHGPGRYSSPHAAEPGEGVPLPDATGTWIVDTNVILVANGQHEDVDPAAQQLCSRWLQALMQTGRVALDAGHAVLGEYLHKTHASGGQGVGDVFLRWLLHEQNNPARVDLVDLPQDASGQFRHFPPDARLEAFDPSDRKFVALSMAHPEHPAIWQATDSKWLDWAAALRDHGVVVQFLCPRTIAAFHDNKSPR